MCIVLRTIECIVGEHALDRAAVSSISTTLSDSDKLMWCIDQVGIEINLHTFASLLYSTASYTHTRTNAHADRRTKMLINCVWWQMTDGDLRFAFAVVVVKESMKARRDHYEGWTTKHKPMIFFSSSPKLRSLNNSICIHQRCICHSCCVLSGSLPSMLCSLHFDSPILCRLEAISLHREKPG